MFSGHISQSICQSLPRVLVSVTIIMLCLQSLEGYPGHRLEGPRGSMTQVDGETRRGRSRRDLQPTTSKPSQLENDQTTLNSSLILGIDNTTKTNTSLKTTDPTGGWTGQGAGTIIGAFFGVLLGGAIVGGALYLLIQYKRAQSAEYNRSVQIHMSSTRNAGVYVDLAEPRDPRLHGIDYTAVPQNSNSGKKGTLMQSDLYEYDSDDEVCVYK